MEINAIVDRYIAISNETDPPKRRALIEQTFTEGATFVDPLSQRTGRDDIDAMVAGLQQQFAGLTVRRRGEADVVGVHVRFSWEMGPAGGEALAGGTDIATVADGRFAAVIGFLDFVPAGLLA